MQHGDQGAGSLERAQLFDRVRSRAAQQFKNLMQQDDAERRIAGIGSFHAFRPDYSYAKEHRQGRPGLPERIQSEEE